MYVYILQCADDSFYTGVTNNLELRFKQHQEGIDPECYTFSRRPLVLAYWEKHQTPMQAIRMEKKIKGWSRAKKLALINGNYSELPGLSECKNESSHKNKDKSQ